MNHAEVREQLELAAIEPDGLGRLMAGDTMEAAAVATHLAGCPACLEEMGRLERTASIVRRALVPALSADLVGAAVTVEADAEFEEQPLPPALRERTLAFVRDHGVRRPVLTLGQAAAMVEPASLADPTVPVVSPGGAPPAGPVALPATLGARARPRFLRPVAWAASIAAAVVFSVVATTLYLGDGRSDETADLTRLASWTIDVARATDARQVVLVSPAGSPTTGLLAFVPSTGALVVSAHDLAGAPSGKEYRCWMGIGGGRKIVGRMHFAGGIAYWVGPVTGLGTLPAGTQFGVTLVDASGSAVDGDPVLLGSL